MFCSVFFVFYFVLLFCYFVVLPILHGVQNDPPHDNIICIKHRDISHDDADYPTGITNKDHDFSPVIALSSSDERGRVIILPRRINPMLVRQKSS